jgi:hypothetical protein
MLEDKPENGSADRAPAPGGVRDKKKRGADGAPWNPSESYLVEVVAVVLVDVVEVVVVIVPVAAGVSVEVVVVVIVEVVPVDPVSSTTLGCSLAVVEVVVSVVEDSSAFLQPPRNRVADAVAAIRKRARDFFIGRSPSQKKSNSKFSKFAVTLTQPRDRGIIHDHPVLSTISNGFPGKFAKPTRAGYSSGFDVSGAAAPEGEGCSKDSATGCSGCSRS